jgi:hypothetical protein
MKHLLLLALLALSARAQDTDGWKTILATRADLKDYPKGQAELQDGLLHTRAGYGLWVPQHAPDGAIRARLHFLEGTAFPQLRIRSSGDLSSRNASSYQLMLLIRQGQTSVSEGQVTAITQGKGRVLGTFPLPEPYTLGGTLDLEISVIRDHLQVLVNDKPAFEIHDTTLPDGVAWGVAAGDAWFSRIQVRTLTPTPAPDEPSPAAQLGKTTDPRILQIQESFTAAITRDITPAHLEAIQALDTKYTAALDRALEAVTQSGDLDGALTLRTEKKRVQDKAPLPPTDSAASALLKPLRATYRSSLIQLAAQRDQRILPLRAKYLQALTAYQDELTRAKKLDAALEVKKFHDTEAARVKAP